MIFIWLNITVGYVQSYENSSTKHKLTLILNELTQNNGFVLFAVLQSVTVKQLAIKSNQHLGD